MVEILGMRLDGTTKDMERQHIEIDILSNRIKRGCVLIETCNRGCMNILKDLSGEAKEEEEKLYKDFAKGKSDFLTIILNCHNLYAQLEAKLNSIIPIIERQQQEECERLGILSDATFK